MRRTRAHLLGALSATLLLANAALAAFPADPPNDPSYAAAGCGPQSEGATGQWNLFDADPGCIPPPLVDHASGISANAAWMVTDGHPDVVIAVLDSGVHYDHEDLRNKIWLNRGELPVPTPPGGCAALPGDPHDCNGDGVFNVADYAGDPRLGDPNLTGATDRGDLIAFADGFDDDGNGYLDDLSGWDSADDDGDEFDHRYFGHGTGRAGIVGPETNNGIGVAGVCPACPLMNVRIDDTFVHTSEGVAKGAIYAVDNGARVINMSLGGTTASRMSRGAFEYAIAHDVLPVNASANEFSAHHNFQAVFDDVMAIGAVTPDNRNDTTTWMQKANFANYGAHLDVVGPTVVPAASLGNIAADGNPVFNAYSSTASGTSSSTPHAAGVAALVFSRGIETGLSPSLSSQEVRQILNGTADDVTTEHATTYPVSDGWDKWTGYGRLNAKAAVDMVAAATIPPEADINSPDWYSLVDGTVEVELYANARRASTFDYVLEVAPGVEPASFTTLAEGEDLPAAPGMSSADLASNFTAEWNAGGLAEGLYTLRLRVTDDLGNRGEDRMAVWVRHPDPQDLAGFPAVFDGSLESLSVALVDLDGDNALEIVFVDGNGEVHAVRSDATELAGFPVHTMPPDNLPLTTSPAFDGDTANGEVPQSFSSLIGGPAVADLDADGIQEIVVAGIDGRLYCWEPDATTCAGFPAETDHGFTRAQYGAHEQVEESHPEGIASTPALGNLDGDPELEIVAGSVEQKLYVWNHDGTRLAPWPMEIFDPAAADPGVSDVAPRAILSSAAIADVDADQANEIVVGTNETYGTPNFNGQGGSGRAYVLEADGQIAPGWPVKPTSLDPDPVPLVAEGIGTSPAVANVDGDPQLEIAITAFLGDAAIYNYDGTTLRTLQGTFAGTGPGSDMDETTPEGGLPRAGDQPGHFYVAQGAFGNVDGGGLEYLTGSVGNGILGVAAGAGPPVLFDHLVSAWDATNGQPKPGFPRVIEDWQFVTGPAVADVNGGSPEIIATSGGFFVHAFSSTGTEAAGWPKLTGQWQTATPSVGDVDGDGELDVVQTTRMGTLFVWSTRAGACQSDEWRKFRHDEWNTGTYGTDTRRPSRVTNLTAALQGDDATLRWSAPGDDGGCGTANHYEIRASADAIDESNFGQAAVVATPPAPVRARRAQTFTFTPPQGARFFALRAVDESGNAGPITWVGPLGGDDGDEDACTVIGSPEADLLVGTPGDDVICGMGGADEIRGEGGNDILRGAGGRDVIFGGTGDDVITGGARGDDLRGNSGNDDIAGGGGNDRIDGGPNRDRCRGGGGRDRVRSC